MKKNFKILSLAVVACFALMATSCEKSDSTGDESNNDNNNDTTVVDSTEIDTIALHTLTFEDNEGESYWADFTAAGLYTDVDFKYEWNDSIISGKSEANSYDYEWDGTTYTTYYWDGGVVISNTIDTTLANGTYLNDLAIYNPNGGNNGSKNFAVCYYSTYNSEVCGISFNDSKARIVQSIYIASTTYSVNAALNGNDYARILTADDYITITATGYDTNNNPTTTIAFNTFENGKMVTEWTKWDLSPLGEVSKITFSVDGTDTGDNGHNQPSYFAIDDITVAL